MIPLCAEHGIEYQAFSPLAGGWLTGKYRRGAGAAGGLADDDAAGAVPAPGQTTASTTGSSGSRGRPRSAG